MKATLPKSPKNVSHFSVASAKYWNAPSAPWDRRRVLVELWAHHNLEVAGIDMSYTPPLLLAQVYYVRNTRWVLPLLLVSRTHTFICLVFEPLCNRPYTVDAKTKELASVNLVAEQEEITSHFEPKVVRVSHQQHTPISTLSAA